MRQPKCTRRARWFLVAAMIVGPALTAGVSAQSPAAGAGADVEVRGIKFNLVRPPGASEAWLEAVVEIGVSVSPGAGVYARYADRVEVALSLALRKRDNDFAFFRASTVAVSLEVGRAAVRFYLPPEILRREQVNGDPYAYLVDVRVEGRALPPVAAAVSSGLRSADALRVFRDHVAQAAPGNDGVLVPQYDSPFATSYPADTPSFVRRSR